MKSKTLLSLVAFTGAFLNAQMASAQSLPPSIRTPEADNTSLGTQVARDGNNFNITGGLNRGQTLFHSFKDFSIPTDGVANFNNPAGTRDIISRVTGNLFSDINGTLNSNGANFLLINPNGVVFGPNARLNVGKAFAASTANGVDLIDGQGRQVTFGTNPNGDAPLLTINPNVFFNVSKLNMGANVPNNQGIVNYGTLQTNNDSQYIGLIGGNVTLDGKSGGGKIVALGGRIDLGGLNSVGTVSTDAQGLVFGGNGLVRGDVLLTDGALVTARATQTLGTVNPFFSNLAFTGSNININANNLNVLNSGTNTGFAFIDNGLAENSGVKTQPAGDININAIGQVNLNKAGIVNTLGSGAEGKVGDIKINANSLSISNNSAISASTAGKGNAGNIELKIIGDISISGSNPPSTVPTTQNADLSLISSNTSGQGATGKITIDTQNQGKISLDRATISSAIGKDAVGNSQGISISAREIELRNGSSIFSTNFGGKGDAGNIDLKTIGDISLSGSTPNSTAPTIQNSSISSNTLGQGATGKITIDTQNQGKISLDRVVISSGIIGKDAVGNSQGISISAREIELRNGSLISSTNAGGKGDAGNIDLKTIGDISISGTTPNSTAPTTQNSSILSNTLGQGNTGKITIDTQNRGKISLDQAAISSGIIGKDAVGNSQGISISAREIELRNRSSIFSTNAGGKGDAGNIDLKTIGDISLSGATPNSTAPTTQNSDRSFISSDTFGQGATGKITIDTQNRGKISLVDGAIISSSISKDAVGNSQGISISAREIELRNGSLIFSSNLGDKNDAGNIIINAKGDLELTDRSFISSANFGQGKTGDISLNIDRITLNSGTIQAESVGGIGGNIQLTTSDLLLLRNSSDILTRSISNEKNGDGGNITIDSPLIIALPGSSDISADAIGGNGGKVDIISKGLFGIQFRPRLSDLTNDITSSSTFGQSGVVDIKTPGTDPGKDSTVLPTVPTDASNQIAQTCNASRENKFIIAGRGGLPPNANDPLTSDVVWQDPRAANSQPTASSTTNDPNKLPPPAVGLAFDGKGKAFLIAAGSEGQPTKTSVVCPNGVRK